MLEKEKVLSFTAQRYHLTFQQRGLKNEGNKEELKNGTGENSCKLKMHVIKTCEWTA